MSRPFLSVVLVGALAIAAAIPAAAQAAKDEDDERGNGREGGSEDRGRSEDRRGPATTTPGTAGGDGHAREQPRPAESVGFFRMEPASPVVHGEHVSFVVNDTGVRQFSADGVFLFNLTVQGGEEDDEDDGRLGVDGSGAQLRYRAPTFSFKAHDNPAATAKLETDGVVTFTFDAGASFLLVDDDVVTFRVGDVTGTLRGEDATLDGRTVEIDGDTLFLLHKARGAYDQHRPDIGNAIAKGHVGAEATLGKREGSGDLVEEVVSYGNVTMTTLKAEKGNLTLAVEGHGTEGRVLVLNVDGRVVGAEKREDLTVLMDNLSIREADGLGDVLDPENDGYLPEYYVVFDPGTESFQLLVSVPHYSVHVLSIMTPIPLPPPSVVLGIVAGVALLVPGAYALFRRKEK